VLSFYFWSELSKTIILSTLFYCFCLGKLITNNNKIHIEIDIGKFG